MRKEQKVSRSEKQKSKQVDQTTRSGSATRTPQRTTTTETVTVSPTSERIIKETTLRRRKALSLLADL